MQNGFLKSAQKAVLMLVVVIAPGLAYATDEAEVTGDRPDFTESATTVTSSRYQIESGYTLTNASDVRIQNFPEMLLRYGFTDSVELRAGFGDLVNVRANGAQAWQRSDAAFGFKYALFKSPNTAWRFSLLGGLSAPTGSADATSKGYDPELKFLWKYEFVNEIEVSGNLNWASETTAITKSRHNVLGASVSVGFELMERLGMFVEAYAIDKGANEGGRADSADAGFVYKILPQFLVDVRGGLTKQSAGKELFFGTGIVYQIGHK